MKFTNVFGSVIAFGSMITGVFTKDLEYTIVGLCILVFLKVIGIEKAVEK